ncbi:hypothetical protein [Paenibacillus sp. RS8]|uniref:hypothetical protein n=1 Tax=Paenibacillus sp. RS8 TaxID=3242681 RepID=UPI0035C0EF77
MSMQHITFAFIFIDLQVIILITNTFANGGASLSFSLTFWIVTFVFVLFMVGILTSSYNDDKTKGL